MVKVECFEKYNNAPYAYSGAYFFPKIQKPKKSLPQMDAQDVILPEPSILRRLY